MRWLVLINAMIDLKHRIVSNHLSHCFFRVFTDAIFVRCLYCFYLMPVTENKTSGFSRLGEGNRRFYMFCVVGEWRL